MLDFTKINVRSFKVKLNEDTELNIEVPKVKTIRKALGSMEQIGGMSESEAIRQLSLIVADIMSKNREKKNISADTVEELMTIDQMTQFLELFFDWVGEIQSSKN